MNPRRPRATSAPQLQLPMVEASAIARRGALIAERDASIRELLKLHLGLVGFQITETNDGADALEIARAARFDLLVLDDVLPGVDGITICRAVRAEGTNRDTPILMLTSRDRESDKVVGLESGADGYLTKPFAVRELLARVTAMMRRSARHHASSTTAAGFIRLRDLALDPDRRQAAIRGRGVELTKQEFDLLYLLASKPGIVFSRTALLGRLWQGDASITERTVDTIVSRLRRKVERDPQNPEMILTAWGVGYKFADVDE